MNKRLFIAGLPFSSNDQDIKTHFSSAGVVTMVQIITDKMTGRSKGFGFVEFETEEMAANAIKMFNETDFGGRKLVVAEAKPMEKREPYNGSRPPARRAYGSESGGRRDSRGGGDRNNDRGFSRGGGRGGYSN